MLEINKIYHMDYLDFLKQVGDESVDLIIIDPPYLVTKEAWDKVDLVNEELSKELYRVGKRHCSLYIWCSLGEKSQSLLRWWGIFNKDWHFKDMIVWKKQRGIGTIKGWLFTREEILWFVKDKKNYIWNKEHQYSNEKRTSKNFGYKTTQGKPVTEYIKSEYKRLTNVWADISEVTFNTSKNNILKGHYTPKPEKAIERIIKAHTKEGDLVLDCFMGSGTTAVVSKRLNRNFIGSEINKDYIKLAEERLVSI